MLYQIYTHIHDIIFDLIIFFMSGHGASYITSGLKYYDVGF